MRRFLQSKKRHAIDHILKAGGLILSEYKLDQRPTHYTYPQRNRIIA
ncbi:hypothetical protein GW750_03940 [bacterium]|nr:hypothetical protein [bacterium]